MRNVVFLASHIGSDSRKLLECLDNNSRIQAYQTASQYHSPLALEPLVAESHKCHHQGAIWLDELLHNHQFSCKQLYEICRFIYVVKEPKYAVPEIVEVLKTKLETAGRYYCYRLRRMYEMARKTPGAVFLTGENLAKSEGFDLLEEHLQLAEPLEIFKVVNVIPPLSGLTKAVIGDCQKSYDRHLFLLQQLDLLKV